MVDGFVVGVIGSLVVLGGGIGFGVGMYVRNRRQRVFAGTIFFTTLLVTAIGLDVAVFLYPFPQGPAGGNYDEMISEMVWKLGICVCSPGLGCFLGGLLGLLAPAQPRQATNSSLGSAPAFVARRKRG